MSNKIQSTNSILVYEFNGEEYIPHEQLDKIIVENHWNRKVFVVLEVAGMKYTVIADHLKRAIQNAENAND